MLPARNISFRRKHTRTHTDRAPYKHHVYTLSSGAKHTVCVCLDEEDAAHTTHILLLAGFKLIVLRYIILLLLLCFCCVYMYQFIPRASENTERKQLHSDRVVVALLFDFIHQTPRMRALFVC